MSKKIIAGNWKQNGTLKSSISLTKKVLQAVKKEIKAESLDINQYLNSNAALAKMA